MRSSRLSSLIGVLLLIASGCKAPYKHLQPVSAFPKSILQHKPVFDRTLYRCVVDGRFLFKKFHLSGLLFFKTMENGTVRAVFQNEMGFSFFDFEWDSRDSFQVNQIIEQLDRPAVVKILQKDLSLLLMRGLNEYSETTFIERDSTLYYRFSLDKGYAYYLLKGQELERIENAGKRKTVIRIDLGKREQQNAMPDSVFIDHYKANFTIQLQKITPDVNE